MRLGRGLLTVLLPLPLLLVVGGAAAAADWSYQGKRGPAFWGDLDPAFARCRRGTQQSPVDLGPAREAVLEQLKFDWQPKPPRVVNTGRMIRVEVGGNRTQVGDANYDLLQFHVHKPAEHRIGERRLPLELHFVHRSEERGLLVIAVMVEEGAANATLQKVLVNAPVSKGATELEEPLAPTALLPRVQDRFRYEGSLSIPPCSETVSWIVYRTPIQASAQQIARFGQFFEGNARPTQPLNRRFILKDF